MAVTMAWAWARRWPWDASYSTPPGYTRRQRRDTPRPYRSRSRLHMSEDKTFTVTGMTCGHCKSAVTTEVLQVEGVQAVDVDLDSGPLTVRGSDAAAAIRKTLAT